MSKYKKAFYEVNLLMNEVLDKFNMTLEEPNFHPTEDIFRIVVREIEVDNLKVISSIFTNNEYHEVVIPPTNRGLYKEKFLVM